jgi:hypothetical protein
MVSIKLARNDSWKNDLAQVLIMDGLGETLMERVKSFKPKLK